MAPLRMAAGIEERQVGPCRLLMLPLNVPDVVSWRGSTVSAPNLGAGDALIQAIVTGLLDRGTTSRDRFACSELLQRTGARLGIDSSGIQIEFRGQTLRRDLPDILGLLAEMLRTPALEADELAKVIGQLRASFQHALDTPSIRASRALNRRVLGKNHPASTLCIQQSLDALAAITANQVRDYHAKHFGARDLTLVVTGDVQPDAVVDHVREAFAGWGVPQAQATHTLNALLHPSGTEEIRMEGKPSLSVEMGHALQVRRTDRDWLPLFVGVYILGGNYSARLMKHVRQDLGLTYGIRAGLGGMANGAEGYFNVSTTLTRDTLRRGISATREVLERFVNEGPTPQELDDIKTTIIGEYGVGLATTRAFADRLHRNALLGFAPDYLDAFPDLVDRLLHSEVVDVVQRHLKPESLHQVVAGTTGD